MKIRDAMRSALSRDDDFYRYLERQAKVARHAATLLATFSANAMSAACAHAALQETAHERDQLSDEIAAALMETCVTPADHGELQKLSVELDAVVDLATRAIGASSMLGVDHPTEPMKKLIEVIVRATAKVDAAIADLRQRRYGELKDAARELREIEKAGDAIYRDGVAALFRETAPSAYRDGSGDPRAVIREKTVLDELKRALERSRSIGLSLTRLAVLHA